MNETEGKTMEQDQKNDQKLEKLYCAVCSKQLLDEYAYKGHMQGRKHTEKAQWQATQQAKLEEKKKCSVFVSMLHVRAPKEEIQNFFLSFGEIKYITLNNKFAIVEYANSRPAQYLLSNPIRFKGSFLTIKKRVMDRFPQVENNKNATNPNQTAEENQKNGEEEGWIFKYDKIKSQMEEKHSFEEQLDFIFKNVLLSEEEIQTIYNEICSSIQTEFRRHFPGCVAHKFGSTVSGLGFKNCDLDIYVDIGLSQQEREGNSEKFERIFKMIKTLMYRNSNVFKKVVPIPRAKIPIIKFTHGPSGVSCDVNFKNELGIHNSNLIRHCLSYDNRLKPAMVIIKYWAKQYNFTAVGRMTNYSLAMMFLFYLQQPSVALIPVIHEMKGKAPPLMVEGWQVNFSNDYQHSNSTNTTSIEQLVCGFFKFYSEFDFSKMVICPLDGVARPRKMFEDLESLPDSMERYKEQATDTNPVIFNITSPICMQDPNELSHNITCNVSLSISEGFITQCKLSYKACSECLESSEISNCNFLPKLFTLSEPQFHSKKKHTDLKFMYKPIEEPNDPAFWYKKVVECVRNIFESIYKIQVKSLPAEAKQQKREETSDVHTNDQMKCTFACTGDFDTWSNRKAFKAVRANKMTYREKEGAVSEAMIKAHEKNEQFKKGSPIVDFTVSLELLKGPTRVAGTFKDVKSSREFYIEMGRYLHNKICHDIDKVLMEAVFAFK